MYITFVFYCCSAFFTALYCICQGHIFRVFKLKCWNPYKVIKKIREEVENGKMKSTIRKRSLNLKLKDDPMKADNNGSNIKKTRKCNLENWSSHSNKSLSTKIFAREWIKQFLDARHQKRPYTIQIQKNSDILAVISPYLIVRGGGRRFKGFDRKKTPF